MQSFIIDISKGTTGKARQGKAKQGKAKQGKARQSKARQSKAKQSKVKLPYLFSSFEKRENENVCVGVRLINEDIGRLCSFTFSICVETTTGYYDI